MQQTLSSENQGNIPGNNLESIKASKTQTRNFRKILVILKVLAGCALLVLSIRGIQIENFISGIRSANLAWLILAILAVMLGLGLKLWRWLIFIRNYHIQVSFSRLFCAFFVGQATNIILPLRGGELVRLSYFAEDNKIIPVAASTIILEKYLDLLALTVSVLLVSYKISLDNLLNMRGFLLPISFGMTVLLITAVTIGPTLWRKARTIKVLPQALITLLDEWVHASTWLRNPVQLIPGILLTSIIWGVMWLTNLFLFKSLGLPLNGATGGLVLVLVYIGLLPALMPGNIGPFYFFASLAIIPFGILHEQAMIFAVLLHAIVSIPPLLGGAAGLLIRSPRPRRA